MKQLAVFDTATKRLEGLDPNRATGIPMPTAQVVTSLPPAGSAVGQLVFDSSGKVTYVWDGTQWHSIQSDFLHTAPTDTDAINLIVPVGHVVLSHATGNVFVQHTTGKNRIGLSVYTNEANLLADTQPEGTVGLAQAEHSIWVMDQGDWVCLSIREMATTADVLAWAPPDGTEALALDHKVGYVRHGTDWLPRSIWLAGTETALLAATWAVEGQSAVAQDTGHMFVWDGTQWQGSPLRHYATETALIADTPTDGVFGWAEDTGLGYIRSGGNWIRVNSPTVTVAQAAPASPTAGDVHFEPTGGAVTIWDGNAWRGFGGNPTGTIIMHASYTPPSGYLLCDGSTIPAGTQYDALRAMVGSRVPDLRDQFVRGAGSQGQINGFSKHNDTTRRPRSSNFTGGTNTAGLHDHSEGPYSWKGGGSGAEFFRGRYSGNSTTSNDQYILSNDGDHSHSVTINGGGDSETAPKHVRLAYHIKV